MHPVQDYARHRILADTNGMLPATLEFIKMALQHKLMHEDHANNKAIASKAADPGTLSIKVDFKSSPCGFRNVMNTIPGVTGIPLDYIISDQVEADIQEDVELPFALITPKSMDS
jgi:hypothetical protein